VTKSDRLLANRRRARDAARAGFNLRVSAAKADLQPAVLKRRVIAEVQKQSLAAATTAAEIANDSRGVVAATALALVLWFARKPITAGMVKLAGRLRRSKSEPKSRIKQMMDWFHRLKESSDD
jgi:hypothetical protein